MKATNKNTPPLTKKQKRKMEVALHNAQYAANSFISQGQTQLDRIKAAHKLEMDLHHAEHPEEAK